MQQLPFSITTFVFAWLCVGIGASGCAGPMTPFGAISLFSSGTPNKVQRSAIADRAQIRFDPSIQVLHGPSAFAMVIEDPMGVPENHRIQLTYNGIDVTPQFLARAEKVFVDSGRQQMRLSVNRLRVLASRENQIEATYWRIPNVAPVKAKYNPPKCSAFQTASMLSILPGFETQPNLIKTINESAADGKINPFYLAGLIAQESAFNPQTLSRRRAIGLTQITPISESQILPSVGSWPRFAGIDSMPLPLLKYSIVNGEINETNEWRLNPLMSVRGGVAYLTYLYEYWNRPDKKELPDRTIGNSEYGLSEVILASYNSGASRVSVALERNGKDWLQDTELREAHKYVRRVVSYCNYFEVESKTGFTVPFSQALSSEGE